ALAHELNQPLMAIRANAQATRRMLREGRAPAMEEVLVDIAQDATRAGDLIARLRDLLRRRQVAKEPLGVEEVLAGVRAIRRAGRGAGGRGAAAGGGGGGAAAGAGGRDAAAAGGGERGAQRGGGDERARGGRGGADRDVGDGGAGDARGGGRGAADRRGVAAGDVHAVFDDEGGGAGDRAGDQPVDRGGARGAAVGGAPSRGGPRRPVHAAGVGLQMDDGAPRERSAGAWVALFATTSSASCQWLSPASRRPPSTGA